MLMRAPISPIVIVTKLDLTDNVRRLLLSGACVDEAGCFTTRRKEIKPIQQAAIQGNLIVLRLLLE